MIIEIEQGAEGSIRDAVHKRLMQGLKKALPGVREVIKTSIADRFDSESAGTPVLPFNTPAGAWKELAPATLKRRNKNRVKKLVVSGDLKKFYNVAENGMSLLVTNNRRANNHSLFLIHQHGADAGKNGTSKIPARPMFALQKDEVDEIIDIILEKTQGV